MIEDENNKALPAAASDKIPANSGFIAKLTAFYLIGAVFGTFLTEHIFQTDLSPSVFSFSYHAVKEIIPLFLLLLFATSCIGPFLISTLFLAEGFSVSADVVGLLNNGTNTAVCFAVIGLPAVLTMAALLSMGGIAMGKALLQKNLYERNYNGTEPIISGARLLSAAVLTAGAGFTAYYLNFLIL